MNIRLLANESTNQFLLRKKMHKFVGFLRNHSQTYTAYDLCEEQRDITTRIWYAVLFKSSPPKHKASVWCVTRVTDPDVSNLEDSNIVLKLFLAIDETGTYHEQIISEKQIRKFGEIMVKTDMYAARFLTQKGEFHDSQVSSALERMYKIHTSNIQKIRTEKHKKSLDVWFHTKHNTYGLRIPLKKLYMFALCMMN